MMPTIFPNAENQITQNILHLFCVVMISVYHKFKGRIQEGFCTSEESVEGVFYHTVLHNPGV
jgi:hypothetical protein